MKHILLFSLVVVLILSCRKDLPPGDSGYLEMAKKTLKDSLDATGFEALDFSRAVRSRVDSIGFFALRVPFKGKEEKEDFVFLQTNAIGQVERGKIVHLKGEITEEGDGAIKRKRWDGTISLTSLDRKTVFQSPVVNGYITALHQGSVYRTMTEVVEGLMPEVIITYTISSSYGLSWSDMYMIQSLLGSGGGIGSSYYSSFSGGGSGSDPWGSGGGSTGSGSTGENLVILVDKEYQDVNPAINVQQYINCFNNIPDAGSTCSIEIYSDIPVDNNSNSFFDISTMSPGHTFISISKVNGAQRVSQNIGFYPISGYKSMTYAPTAGKLVDNARHEFNASLSMALTPAQLSTILLRVQQWSNLNYDVDQYNCTDWALDIFNSVRASKLDIPLYGIPGSPMTQATRTPQGLYQKLQQMMSSNDPEKGNITIGIIKGYAGGSTGPCN
jgi:hypothetical protein